MSKLYKVLCGTDGVKILKFNIGSETNKTISYQSGNTKRRIRKEELDILQVAEVSLDDMFNNAYIFTTQNLDENNDLKLDYSLSCLKTYKDRIEVPKNKLVSIIERLEVLEEKLGQGESSINIDLRN